MSKHLQTDFLLHLPSGNRVHPCRLIHKDGTIMWKHALIDQHTRITIPMELAHETHIIKTAQRLEELNSWVSQALDPWECLLPSSWYSAASSHSPFAQGYACTFSHTLLSDDDVYQALLPHVQSHEQLCQTQEGLYFQRC